jgi:hypothetical protein
MGDLTVGNEARKYIAGYWRENKRLPSIESVARWLNISQAAGKACMDHLVESGLLKIDNGRYAPNDIQSLMSEPSSRPPVTKEAIVKPIGDKVAMVGKKAPRVIQWTMGCVAIVDALVSWSFGRAYAEEFLPTWQAWLMAAAVVGYVAAAPEAAIEAWRAGQRMVPVVLIVAYIPVILFSSTAIIAGQYNKRSAEMQTTESIESSKNNAEHEALKAIEKDIRATIVRLNEDAKIIKDGASRLDPKSWEYRTEMWRLQKVNDEIAKNEKDLQEVSKKILTGAVAISGQKRENFFTWVGRSTGWPSNLIEFFLSIAPAIFCDLIAPLGLMVALGGRK